MPKYLVKMRVDDQSPQPIRCTSFSCSEMADTPPTAVPPRTTSHATNGRGRSQTFIRNQDFRQLLIGMGFPKHRAYVMGGGGEGGKVSSGMVSVCLCVCVDTGREVAYSEVLKVS